MPQTIVILTSGSSWTVPAGCYLLDYVDCVGAGGSGAAAILHGVEQGGGGGAFSRKNNGGFGGGGGTATTDNTGFPTATSGAGGNGLIRIAYTLINQAAFNMPMLGM